MRAGGNGTCEGAGGEAGVLQHAHVRKIVLQHTRSLVYARTRKRALPHARIANQAQARAGTRACTQP
eukprot:2069997-Pleurochrysis_carterae.AAC.2